MPRISASSYSNTAPLIWSFLYGSYHGKAEIILDNAPARSAELLAQNRVDVSLVPVIAYQMIDGLRMIPDVCVGAREKARSVCLVTKAKELPDIKSVALDISSKTSVVLTKIIFREFLGFEPAWLDAEPHLETMLAQADAALIIGDPALSITDLSEPGAVATWSTLRKFDLAELWYRHTGQGFVFAMWMTKGNSCEIDFAAARDEGLAHIDEIAANYDNILSRDDMKEYLTKNISYSIDDNLRQGMNLFFELAVKHGEIERRRPLVFI